MFYLQLPDLGCSNLAESFQLYCSHVEYFSCQVWNFHCDLYRYINLINIYLESERCCCTCTEEQAMAPWGTEHSINSSADCCDLLTGTPHGRMSVTRWCQRWWSRSSCVRSAAAGAWKWNVVRREEGTFAGTCYNHLFCSPCHCCSFHCRGKQ